MYLRKIIFSLLKNFPNLKNSIIAVRDHWNTVIPARETPFGFKFAGPSAMTDGSFEHAETPIIRRLIAQNDIFINIGANVGYYCCFAAIAEKPIIAFEPHAVNSRILLRNLEINGFSKNVEIYPTAVGAENGILKLFGSGTAASLVNGWAGISSENSTLVPVVTLDGVLAGRFEDQSIFILIDVEGAEFSVIQGAVATLKRNRKPWWMIEICITDHQPAGVKINPYLLPTFDLLNGAGYEVWTLSNTPRRIIREEVVKIDETEIDTIKIHNFLCVDPSCATEALEAIKRS
jgi:FkbM family methyltransferase